MDKLIPSNQLTFFKGRQLVDGVVAINVVMELVKKCKHNCLFFKVDFKKAYDAVSWRFLEYQLKIFSFDDKWCVWVCLQVLKLGDQGYL